MSMHTRALVVAFKIMTVYTLGNVVHLIFSARKQVGSRE